MLGIKKEGPPLLFEVYTDGRYRVELSSPPTRRELTLRKILRKHVEKKELDGISPGRYRMNFVNLALWGYDIELTSIE